MADPCYEDDIPYPISEEFFDGEKAITVGPDIEDIPASAYFISRWMDFEAGLYTIKGIGDTALRMSIGFDSQSARVSFANTALIGVQEGVIYIPKGRQRIDICLQALASPSGTAYVAFSLFKNGTLFYASSADEWMYGQIPLLDEELVTLPDERLNFPVFTLLPNWDQGVNERIMFETEIFTSESDVEQRRSLRRFPRRSIEAGFLRTDNLRTRLDVFLTSLGHDECLVPLWFEQVLLTAGISSALPTFDLPAGEAALREFRVGDLVVIMGKTPEPYSLATVDEIVDDQVTLVFAETGQEWPAGSRVMPLRTARVESDATTNNLNSRVGRTQIRFDLSEPENQFYEGFEPDDDVFPWEPEWQAPVDHTYSRLDFMFDTVYGRKQFVDVGQRARVGSRFSLRFFGRQDFIDFRRFIGAKRGRARRFMLRTYTRDIIPIEAMDGPTLVCRATGFAKYMHTPQEARVNLYIETFDDTGPLIVQIMSCEESSPGIETFQLDTAGDPIPLSNMKRVGFLMPVRFDQDAFEITHYVDNCAAVEVPIVTRSVEANNWLFIWPDDGSGGEPPPPPDGGPL